MTLKNSNSDSLLEIREKFKCYGELLIHFLLCLLVTNILLFSHHPPPPSPPLLSKVRPSHISVPGSFEGQPALLCLQMRRSGVSGIVDVANVPANKQVLCPQSCPALVLMCPWMLVANLRCCSESRSAHQHQPERYYS